MTSDAELREIASETLETVEFVAKCARNELDKRRSNPALALSQFNTFTDTNAIRAGSDIVDDLTDEYRQLAEEPVLARIGVEEEDGKRRTFYFARSSTVSGVKDFASYRAPIGQLASKDVGDYFILPNGSDVEIVERLLLRPVRQLELWDSLKTRIYLEDEDVRLIPSLRELIDGFYTEEEDPDPFAEWDAKHRSADADIQRDVLRGISLRDQAILDKVQDGLFRLPLTSKVLLQGPPGTGKTTTLIRRLGQKLNLPEEMTEDLSSIARARRLNEIQIKDSWIMFTPTQLLELYLKDAFGREGIPADRTKVMTWEGYSHPFAKDGLRLLRGASGGGGFVLKKKDCHLSEAVHRGLIDWFEAFTSWNDGSFYEQFLTEATGVAENSNVLIAQIAEGLGRSLREIGASGLHTALVAHKDDAEKMGQWAAEKRIAIRDRLDRKFTGILNRNQSLAPEFLLFLEDLKSIDEAISDLTDDILDEGLPRVTSSGRDTAYRAYRNAMQALAQSRHRNRPVAQNSRNARVISWLAGKGNVLGDDEGLTIGAELDLLRHVSFLADPVGRYFGGIPARYRAFRRENKDGLFVAKEIEAAAVTQLELDLLILTYLKSANRLISNRIVSNDLGDKYWNRLSPVVQELKHQVAVDEATDFSPIQLAAMYQLAHPDMKSFFACGDFNQRLTRWGTATDDQLRWAVPAIEQHSINIEYRQSRKLSEFSSGLLTEMTGVRREIQSPDFGEHTGVAPALLENSASVENTAQWISQRILEIERAVGYLPSTAVFVNSEEAVVSLSSALGDFLAEHNIVVKPCPNGEVMGQDSNVRVFAIEHIKGLEFEAAFFSGLDELAEREPDLFEKFLYVGATRAATYLGLTCNRMLPKALDYLRHQCADAWPD